MHLEVETPLDMSVYFGVAYSTFSGVLVTSQDDTKTITRQCDVFPRRSSSRIRRIYKGVDRGENASFSIHKIDSHIRKKVNVNER